MSGLKVDSTITTTFFKEVKMENKELFFCSEQNSNAATTFDLKVMEAVMAAIAAGLGSRFVGYMLVQHATEIGFSTTNDKAAVLHNIMSSVLHDIEKVTPQRYFTDGWFEANVDIIQRPTSSIYGKGKN